MNGIFLYSVLSPTLFCFIYINNLPKKNLRSWANIYADDTAKNLSNQSLAADFFSELALTAQSRNNCLATFNTCKIKQVTFTEQTLKILHSWFVVFSIKRFALSICWGLKFPEDSSAIQTYKPSLKMLERWSVTCTNRESTWLPLPCFIFARVTDQTEAIFCRVWDAAAQWSQSPKAFMWLCKWGIIFHPTNSFSQIKFCKPLAALSLFLWQIFRYATFLSASSFNIYGWDLPCYVHKVELSSFPLNSFGKREDPFSFLPKTTTLWMSPQSLWSWPL